MPAGSPRKNARCGAESARMRDLQVGGKPVRVVLCGVHYRVLIESNNAVRLARSWGAGT
jgi:hypothetical protein